jgi:hypothetical protein
MNTYIQALYHELEGKHLRFKPYFWISEEWFCPDGYTGIAIPFYLIHPKLKALERKHMLEVEGGTREWCMKILRHETGHAIENAYNLRKRKLRQKFFGKTTQPYERFYTPKPYSRKFVLHLDNGYAQSHPDEDFAETFAVWLDPKSNWRNRYAGWPVFKKLEYMDRLMNELRDQKPLHITQRRIDPVEKITKTIRQHYLEKRAYFRLDAPTFYDKDLKKVFVSRSDKVQAKASQFIKQNRVALRREIAHWTGTYQYVVDSIIEKVIARSDELDLVHVESSETAGRKLVLFLSVQTMNYLHRGYHRHIL